MKILAIAAHPDDLEISVGGTLRKYVQARHEVRGVVVTVPYLRETRTAEARAGAAALGFELVVLDFPPDELVFTRKLVGCFDSCLDEFPADVVFTQWIHDSHQDHVNVAQATLAATRKNRCTLYMYEETIPGGIVPYAFRPQVYFDISDTMETKIEASLKHASEVAKCGREEWESGIRGRAMFRGRQIGVTYAEAFELVKEIKRL
ncbi:MAG: PIG-L family deacetylase [Planctomycetes bacterium]|nr:PIG-L family deacetylase [Planctomycetota bacterium]